MSQSGRSSLRLISKDLRNAGYKNINYTRSTWDRWIEKKENYNNDNKIAKKFQNSQVRILNWQ